MLRQWWWSASRLMQLFHSVLVHVINVHHCASTLPKWMKELKGNVLIPLILTMWSNVVINPFWSVTSKWGKYRTTYTDVSLLSSGLPSPHWTWHVGGSGETQNHKLHDFYNRPDSRATLPARGVDIDFNLTQFRPVPIHFTLNNPYNSTWPRTSTILGDLQALEAHGLQSHQWWQSDRT